MALYGNHARAGLAEYLDVVNEPWPDNPLEWIFRAGPRRGQPKIVVDHGCWIWQGALEKKGYGEVYFPGAEFPGMRRCRKLRGKKVPPGWFKCRAHQLTYFIKHGRNAPKGAELSHSCMRRSCCHWDHVTPSTMLQNYQNKFYPPDIPDALRSLIELRIARDEPFAPLADEYGMSVWNIRTMAENMDWDRALERLMMDERLPIIDVRDPDLPF